MPIPKLIVHPVNLSQTPIPKNVDSELTFISNNTFCNVLQQISSLSNLANSIFEELTKDLSSITERSMRLSKRMKTISEDLSTLKKGEEDFNSSNVSCDVAPFVSKKPADSQVLNKNTIPLSMRMNYEKAEAPPPVQIMDKLRDDGRVSMKMYSNPSFFFDLWSQEMLQGHRGKKIKKKKAKGNQPGQKNGIKPSNGVHIEQTGLGTGQIQPVPNGVKYPNDIHRQDQGYQSSTSISEQNADHNLAMMTGQMLHIKQQQQHQNQHLNGNLMPQNNMMHNQHHNNQQCTNSNGVMQPHLNQMLNPNQNPQYPSHLQHTPQNPYQSMMMPSDLLPNGHNINPNLHRQQQQQHQNINNFNSMQHNQQQNSMLSNQNHNQQANQRNNMENKRGKVDQHALSLGGDLPPPPPAPLFPASTPTLSNYAPQQSNTTNTSKAARGASVEEVVATPTPPPPPPPPPGSSGVSTQSSSEYPCPPPPVLESKHEEEERNQKSTDSSVKTSSAPPPPPPPPPPPGSTQVPSQPTLKKSAEPAKKTPVNNSAGGPPQDLLSAIRAGCTLRKVSETQPPIKDRDLGNGFTTLTKPHKDVQSIYDAVIKRRHMMEATSDSDKDSSDSTDGWED